jgi:hypothetical protein
MAPSPKMYRVELQHWTLVPSPAKHPVLLGSLVLAGVLEDPLKELSVAA